MLKRNLLYIALLLIVGGGTVGAATFIQDVQIKSTATQTAIGSASATQLSTILSNVNSTVDQPGHMYATFPTADALLHIRAPQTTAGDGSAKSIASTSSLVPLSITDTTINFQTGVTAGGATVLTDGGTFTLPTTVVSHFRRMVAVYQKDGTINTHFGGDQATTGALENPGTLMASLNGDPIGWVDLQATAGTAYKSANASTSVIQDSVSGTPTITSFGAGGGGGGGNGSSFIIWHPVDGQAPLKAEEFSEEVYEFASGITQQLRGTLKVPTSYAAGNPIKVKFSEYSPDTSGTNVIVCTTDLIRKATDAVSSTTNASTSTITVTLGSPANIYNEVSCAVTDASGKINSVSVNPGDILAIYISRTTDTATSDARILPGTTEVTFQ